MINGTIYVDSARIKEVRTHIKEWLNGARGSFTKSFTHKWSS